MDTNNILVLSPKTPFYKTLKELLSKTPSMVVERVSALSTDISISSSANAPLVIIDYDAFSESLEIFVPILQNHYPGSPLLLVSEKVAPVQLFDIPGIFLIDESSMTSPLFHPLIRTLQTQSSLIQTKMMVEEDLNNRLSELHLIRKSSLHLTMNLSLDSVLESILDNAMDLVSADDTHVFLYEHGVLSFAAALFDGQEQHKPFMDPRPHGMTYKVAREGKKFVVNDALSDPIFEDRRWEGSIISLPLMIGQKVLGVMNVAIKRAHIFTENEIRVLEFLGDQAAIAIQNAKLYEQAQKEIADRKKAEKAIKHLANHDALTGLPNRRLFNERINLEIARSQRKNLKIGVMMFDLDHLKKVNDSYGHNVGDMLLQAVAQRMLGLLRKSDTVARMGGDEFLLILPEMNQFQDAIQTAERILSTLSTPFHLEGYQINITTSIGVAFYPDDGNDVAVLIKNADIAMYKAKEKGGNVFHLYTS